MAIEMQLEIILYASVTCVEENPLASFPSIHFNQIRFTICFSLQSSCFVFKIVKTKPPLCFLVLSVLNMFCLCFKWF